MDNRDAVRARARDLFAARGYDAVGVQEIADAAGVGKPTLYHYFGNKRGLLDAVLAAGFERFDALLVPALRYDRDLTMSLRATASACFEAARSDAEFYRLQLALWFAPPESEGHQAVLPYLEREQRRVEELFVQASRENGNMRGRHQAYAATFLGTMNTYVGLALSGRATLDDALVRNAVSQFMHGILS